MNKIKILVSAHKDVYVPENILLQPIQAGAALAEKRLPGMLHDDEGQQISGKNKAYCELTVQYWAWKNLEADYYGFFHYRRYLDFSKEYPLRTQKGYRIAGSGRYAGREGLTECRRYSGRRHLTGHRRLTGDGYFKSRVAPYKEADSIRKDLSAYGRKQYAQDYRKIRCRYCIGRTDECDGLSAVLPVPQRGGLGWGDTDFKRKISAVCRSL